MKQKQTKAIVPWLYLAKVLQNFSWIYHIWDIIQCFELWKSAIMDQSVKWGVNLVPSTIYQQSSKTRTETEAQRLPWVWGWWEVFKLIFIWDWWCHQLFSDFWQFCQNLSKHSIKRNPASLSAKVHFLLWHFNYPLPQSKWIYFKTVPWVSMDNTAKRGG